MTAPVTTTTTTAASSGTGVFGALLTIIGLLASAFPNMPVLHMLTVLLPQAQAAVPVLIALLGTLMTVVSHPPAFVTKLLASTKSAS